MPVAQVPRVSPDPKSSNANFTGSEATSAVSPAEMARDLYEMRPLYLKREINSVPKSIDSLAKSVLNLIYRGDFKVQKTKKQREIFFKTELVDPEFKEKVPITIRFKISPKIFKENKSDKEVIQAYFSQNKNLVFQELLKVFLHEYSHAWIVLKESTRPDFLTSTNLRGIKEIELNLNLRKEKITKSGKTFFDLVNLEETLGSLEHKFGELQTEFAKVISDVLITDQLELLKEKLEEALVKINKLLKTSLILLYSFLSPLSINKELVGETSVKKEETVVSEPSWVDWEKAEEEAKSFRRAKEIKKGLAKMLKQIREKIGFQTQAPKDS